MQELNSDAPSGGGIPRLAPRGILPGFGGLDQPPGYAESIDGMIMMADGSFATPSALLSLNINPNPASIQAATVFNPQDTNYWYTLVAGPKPIPAIGHTLYVKDIGSPAIAFTPADSIFWHEFTCITPTAKNKIYYKRGSTGARSLKVQFTPTYELIDQPMGVWAIEPTNLPHTKSGTTGDWYFYYVALMDETGVEGVPYLFREIQRSLPIDTTNPQSITLPDNFETRIGGPPDTRTFRAVLYRMGRDVTVPRRVAIIDIAAGAAPTVYSDVTTDAQLSLDVMKWDREMPSSYTKFLVLHDNRMAALTDTTVYMSRLNEYENFYSYTYGTDPTGAWPIDIPTVSGEEVLGGISTEDGLVVFTNMSTFLITGDNYANYRPTRLAAVGALNYRCFSMDSKTVWFIGGDRRLYTIARNQFGRVELNDTGEIIDERFRQVANSLLGDIELVAHQSLVTILLPGIERMVLSIKGSRTWTKFSSAVHFTDARALKSPRPEDGLILLAPNGHTISAFRHDYQPGGASFQTSWNFTSRMFWLGGEAKVKHLSLRADFVDIDLTTTNSITLRCYRRKRDGDLEYADHAHTIETPNSNGWCVVEPEGSDATAEWVSILGQGRGEATRVYGFELYYEPERRREMGA